MSNNDADQLSRFVGTAMSSALPPASIRSVMDFLRLIEEAVLEKIRHQPSQDVVHDLYLGVEPGLLAKIAAHLGLQNGIRVNQRGVIHCR
jgi:hypothetical protein